MTKIDQWIKGERWNELQQVMELPVVQAALEIVEQMAKPNAAINLGEIRNLPAPEASFHFNRILNTQAGIQAAVDKFRSLAHPVRPKEPDKTPAPFDHIKPDYLENRQQ